MRRGFASTVVFGALSLGGLLGAHFLSYFFAVPHDHRRGEALAGSGHGPHWLLQVITIATVVILLAALGRRQQNRASTRPRLVPLAIAFACVQLTGFVILEAVERSSVGVDVLHLLEEGPFLLGLVLQVVAGVVVALLAVGLWTAVAAFVRRAALPTVERTEVIRPRDWVPRVRVEARAWGLRGPPNISSIRS